MEGMRTRGCIWLVLGVAACAGDLPLAERIASVRPLAVRSEVM